MMKRPGGTPTNAHDTLFFLTVMSRETKTRVGISSDQQATREGTRNVKSEVQPTDCLQGAVSAGVTTATEERVVH